MQRQHIRRFARIALAGALSASLLAGGCSIVLSRNGLSGVIGPSIVPSSAESGRRTVEHDFTFEEAVVRLHVPVDRSVYAGSVAAPKTALLLGGASASNWVPDYYRAFVAEKHQDAFYTSALEALHTASAERGLDSSRYVELVTSMAQSLEYRIDPGNLAPKFPIETYGDGYGDCDDKALLAAALLSRDGYDVAILLFPPEKHVALGIRAPGLNYKKTGYAYVEMTAPTLVGVPTENLAGGVRLTSRPQVIRIGTGTRSYDAGSQILYIQQRLAEARSAKTRIQRDIDSGSAKLDAEQAALEAERQQLQANPQASAAAVQSYNARVQAANDRAAQINALIARYNDLAAAERFVAEHQDSRPQVYDRLRALRF